MLSKKMLSFVIMLVGILMMIFGLSRGENEIMFEKAIKICLECIGIG